MAVDSPIRDFVIPFALDEKTAQAVRPLIYRPWGTRPVKLLVVLAAPGDQPELDMARVEAGIRQALQKAPVELTVLRHATIESLHNMLLDVEPHILHFSGHGVVSDGVGALALENPATGTTDPLTARQLRGLLNRMGITLAVLNACETARHSTRDALMGVAQALIREEIPAVIAMQFLVSETAAKAPQSGIQPYAS